MNLGTKLVAAAYAQADLVRILEAKGYTVTKTRLDLVDGLARLTIHWSPACRVGWGSKYVMDYIHGQEPARMAGKLEELPENR